MTEVGLEWLLSVSATPMLIVTDAVFRLRFAPIYFLGWIFRSVFVAQSKLGSLDGLPQSLQMRNRFFF